MATPELRELQDRQWEHDRDYHHDIHSMEKLSRLNHYVHHFSKYVGRLAQEHDEDRQEEVLKKTIADAAIVSLATANTMEIDFQGELEETFGVSQETVTDWTDLVDNTGKSMDVSEVREWLFTRLAIPTGKLADGLESLDHMESINLSEIFDENLVEILSFLMVASNQLEEGLPSLIEDRWETLEEEAIR